MFLFKFILLFYSIISSLMLLKDCINNTYLLYASFLLSIFLFFFLYKRNKVSFFLLIQFLIAFIWCVFSLFYIEHGNFISEQGIIGNNIGSLFRYTFYYSIFLFSSYTMLEYKNLKYKKYKIWDNRIKTTTIYNFELFTIIFHYFILCMSFAIGAIYGFPLFSGISRFEFYNIIAPLDKIIFLMPILSFCIGINYSLSKNKKYIVYILQIILLLIIFSDKFSGIFGVLIYYTIGFYLQENISKNTHNIGFSKKVITLYFPILFAFLLFTVIMGFFLLHNVSMYDIQDRLLSRALGLQAHVWYGIDFRLYFDIIQYNPNIFILENREPEQPAGLAYLMYQVSDYNFVKAFREAGIRFTNGYPAIVLISFGYGYSIVILILLGMTLGYFLHYLYLKVYYLQPIRLITVLVFYNNILINIFIMGEVFYIYKLIGLMCLIIIMIDIFLFKHKNFKFKLKF